MLESVPIRENTGQLKPVFWYNLYSSRLIFGGKLRSLSRLIYYTLCEKCLYLELFWSIFFRIRTEYGEMLRISPYLVRMHENTDKNNSEYGHFLRSDGG